MKERKSVPLINEELKHLYKGYYQNLLARQDNFSGNPSCPLLMKAFPEYENIGKRLLLVGKETNWWKGHLKENFPIEDLFKLYEDFALGYRFTGFDEVKRKTLNSPFWNFGRNLYSRINDNTNRKSLGYLWSNISKMDSGAADRVMPEEERYKEDFELLKKEIAIVQPDVIVFIIGNDYNAQFSDFLKLDASTDTIHPNIKRVTDEDSILPINSFKMYHPNYLVRNGLYYPVLETLSKMILEK